MTLKQKYIKSLKHQIVEQYTEELNILPKTDEVFVEWVPKHSKEGDEIADKLASEKKTKKKPNLLKTKMSM